MTRNAAAVERHEGTAPAAAAMQVLDLIGSSWMSQAIATAAELRLPDLIGDAGAVGLYWRMETRLRQDEARLGWLHGVTVMSWMPTESATIVAMTLLRLLHNRCPVDGYNVLL